MVINKSRSCLNNLMQLLEDKLLELSIRIYTSRLPQKISEICYSFNSAQELYEELYSGIPSGSRILELGFGGPLHLKYTLDLDYTGVDIDETSILFSRVLAEKLGLKNHRYIQADAYNLDEKAGIEPNSMDYVVVAGLPDVVNPADHEEELRALFTQAYRKLRSGGQLRYSTYMEYEVLGESKGAIRKNLFEAGFKIEQERDGYPMYDPDPVLLWKTGEIIGKSYIFIARTPNS